VIVSSLADQYLSFYYATDALFQKEGVALTTVN